MTSRLQPNRRSPKMTCVTMTEQKYGAIIVGAGQAGSPLATPLPEAVSKLIQTMLEVLESCAA
jgi:hypothetical protein